MFASLVDPQHPVEHALGGRGGWLHVARGSAVVNGQALGAGDGIAIEGEPRLSISSPDEAEVLLFDFPL